MKINIELFVVVLNCIIEKQQNFKSKDLREFFLIAETVVYNIR